MRHGTNCANNLEGFSLKIMRHLLYFFVPSLTFSAIDAFRFSIHDYGKDDYCTFSR